MDLGIDVRTTGYETDVGLRPRLQILRTDPFALGVDMLFSGGGGPNKRNSFTYELGLIATLIAGSWVRVNLRPYLMVSTDRLCPSVDDLKSDDSQTGMNGKPGSGNLYANEPPICKVFDTQRTDYTGLAGTTQTFASFGQTDPRARFVTTRFMLQGTVEVAFTKNVGGWALLEGAPGQGQRQAFTGKFNSIFPANDYPLYGRIGITVKF
jgi:hypothetical protein